MPHIVAESFLARHDHQLTALGSVVLAVLAVALVNRFLTSRAERLAARVGGGTLSPVADTRLRFLRRVIDATIIVIGVSVALSQFTALDRVAGTVLASSAIAAAVLGFAARTTLANAVAGLLLAVTQPLRIGDSVTFEGETGVVEDVALTYTWLRTGADARVIIPNERLAGGILRNDSIISSTVAVEASVWVKESPAEAVDRLRAALPGHAVRVAECTADATRILLIGDPVAPADRARAEAELREAALRAATAARSAP